jgi:hypothetical protein
MTTLVGNNGTITVASQNVAEVRNYSIDVTADTIETSVMGTDARTYVKGMSTFSGSADVFWDPTHWSAITGGNPTDTGSLVGATGLAINIFPAGSGAKWSGSIIITGYSVTASMDGLIEASISFQGSGAVAYGS